MELLLTLLCLACAACLAARVLRTAGLLELGTAAVAGFLCLYTVGAGLLFWLDIFGICRLLAGLLVLLAGLCIVCRLRMRAGAAPAREGWKAQLVPALLAVVAVLLSFHNFELFHCGQDQGLYQVEAMALYKGQYEVEHDFHEYALLESAEDKATYYNMLDGIIVYYPLTSDRYYPYEEGETLSDVSGMYHGVQTYPALLALGGRLFGLRNMAQMQTVIFVCSVLLLYYTLCSLGLPMSRRLLAVALFLLSPLAIWVSRATFTEGPLTLYIAFYLFLLARAGNRAGRWLLALPLAAFAFLHVSFLILYPAFIAVEWLLYLRKGEKEYLWANLLTSLSTAAGFWMMTRIAPIYVAYNVARLYFGNIITAGNIAVWVCGAAAGVSVCTLLLARLKRPQAIFTALMAKSWVLVPVLLALLALIARNSYITGYILTTETSDRPDLTAYYGEGFTAAFTHSTLFAFALAAGVLALPYLLWRLLRKPGEFLQTPLLLAATLLLFYCIPGQFALFRKEVRYYYYYSRYLAFYIPLFCVAFGSALARGRAVVGQTVAVLSLAVMLFFDNAMLRYNDISTIDWDTMLALSGNVQPGSAVVLTSDDLMRLGPQIRILSGADIYPVMRDTGEQALFLEQHYDNIYYLARSFDGSTVGLPAAGALFEQAWQTEYTEEDTYVTKQGYYPLQAQKTRHILSLYRLVPTQQFKTESLFDAQDVALVQVDQEVYVAGFPLRIEPNTIYRVSLSIPQSSGQDPGIVWVDLYAGPEYDSGEQEKSGFFVSGQEDYWIYLDSGSFAAPFLEGELRVGTYGAPEALRGVDLRLEKVLPAV